MAQRVYLDYCATTPVHPAVRTAILLTLDEDYGNPSSLHSAGQRARTLVDTARSQVAAGLGADAETIHFTSGATEADNIALLGVMRARRSDPGHKGHLIVSGIEHHAVLHAAEALAEDGFVVTFLDVDGRGRVDPDDVRRAIRADTTLISVMMVNNEVGTIQPIAEIGEVAREHGVLFHTDAVQAVGLLDVDVEALGIDLLSLSGHKIYGPKGIGALMVRQGISVSPLTHGGTQESALRPGTENVGGIAGLGSAVALVAAEKTAERDRLRGLRQMLIEGMQENVPQVMLNGDPDHGAPHIASLSFPGASAEMMLFHLDRVGVAVSMGSACNARAIEPSHVLAAMGLPLSQIDGTLRFSLGHPTTQEEIAYVCQVMPDIVRRCS